MKGKYLITADNWFYAPNGKKYRAAWGDVKVLLDDELGVKTNRNSTNWYAFVGSEEKGILIAGCQIHYAVKCDTMPNYSKVSETQYNESGFVEITRDCEIYMAE